MLRGSKPNVLYGRQYLNVLSALVFPIIVYMSIHSLCFHISCFTCFTHIIILLPELMLAAAQIARHCHTPWSDHLEWNKTGEPHAWILQHTESGGEGKASRQVICLHIINTNLDFSPTRNLLCQNVIRSRHWTLYVLCVHDKTYS